MDLTRNQLIAVGVTVVLALAAGAAFIIGVPTDEDAATEEAPKARGDADKPSWPKLTGARADQIPDGPTDIPQDDYQVVDGVKIHDLVVGTGKEPQKGSLVKVEYAGWLANGKPFDSSYKRTDPFEFTLETGSVIQGWHIGVAGMKEGGKRQIVIPPDKGYGSRDKGSIPPNSVLVFQIELLEVGPTRLAPDTPAEVADGAWQSKGGLRWADVAPGEGDALQAGSVVSFDMTAFNEDGSKRFVSSYDGQEAIEAVLGTGLLLPAWDEAMLGMKAGGKRLVLSPPDKAYGPKGRGPIPPNATLLFEIDVHEVGDVRVVPKKPTRTGDYTTTDDGLKVADLVVGDGASPEKGETVWCEYAGWLEDGTLFDSSYKRPGPFSFQLHTGRVIKGWHKGVDGMKVGGKRQLVIPPDLAYGERGGGPIPPNATLTFEIELVGIGKDPPE